MITPMRALSVVSNAHLFALSLLLVSGCSLFEATPSCVSDEQCAPAERCELGRCELSTVMITQPFIDAQLDLGAPIDRGIKDMSIEDMELDMGGALLYTPRLESCSRDPALLNNVKLNPIYEGDDALSRGLVHKLSCLHDDVLLFSKPLAQGVMTESPEELWLHRSFMFEGINRIFFERLTCNEQPLAINPNIITGVSFGVTKVDGDLLDQLLIHSSRRFASEFTLHDRGWVSLFPLSAPSSEAACPEAAPRPPIGSPESVQSVAYGDAFNLLLMSDASGPSELMFNAFGLRRQCALSSDGVEVFDEWALTVMHNKLAWLSLEDAGSDPNVSRLSLVLNIQREMDATHQPRVNVGDELSACPQVIKRRLGVSFTNLNLQDPLWRARYQLSYDPFTKRLSLCVPTVNDQECWLYEWSEEGGLKALMINERPLKMPFAFQHHALGERLIYVDNRERLGIADYQLLKVLAPCALEEEQQAEGERCYQEIKQLERFQFSGARLMYFRSDEEAPSLYVMWVEQSDGYAILRNLKL